MRYFCRLIFLTSSLCSLAYGQASIHVAGHTSSLLEYSSSLIKVSFVIQYIACLMLCTCILTIVLGYFTRLLSIYFFKKINFLCIFLCAIRKSLSMLLFASYKSIYQEPISGFLNSNFGALVKPFYSHELHSCVTLLANAASYVALYQFLKVIISQFVHDSKIFFMSKFVISMVICRILINTFINEQNIYLSIITGLIIIFSALLLFELILLSRKIVLSSASRYNNQYILCFLSLISLLAHHFFVRRYNYVSLIQILLILVLPQLILYLSMKFRLLMLRYISRLYSSNGKELNFKQTRDKITSFVLFVTKILRLFSFLLLVLLNICLFNLDVILVSFISLHILGKICLVFIVLAALYSILFVIDYTFLQYTEKNMIKTHFDTQRIKAFANISKVTFNILAWITCILILLCILGVNIMPIFQSIGLFSAAISLSIQQFIRDIVNGILILYDRSIQINDIIEIDGKTCLVESMALRYLRARSDDGTVSTVPYHKIDIIKNRNRQYTAFIMNMCIEGDVPIEKAEAGIRHAFGILKDQIEMRRIIRSIELRDIVDFTAFAYVMQVKVSATNSNHNKARRAFMRILKKVFEEQDIRIARPGSPNINTAPSASTLSPYPDFE